MVDVCARRIRVSRMMGAALHAVMCLAGCHGLEVIGSTRSMGTDGSTTGGSTSDDSTTIGPTDQDTSGFDSSAGTTSHGDASGTAGSTGDIGGTSATTTGLDPTPVDPCDVRVLDHSDGLVVTVVERDPWEEGTCHDFTVRNDTDEDLLWWVRARLGGELYQHWNSESEALDESAWEFRGAPYSNNVALLVGQQTVFGTCMNCDPFDGTGTTGTGGSAGTGATAGP